MSLLAAITIAAAFLTPPRAASAAPCAVTCSALELTGTVAEGGITLDPAFDIAAGARDLAANVGGEVTPIVAEGFAADGRPLFSVQQPATAPFRIVVALPPETLALVSRIRVSYLGSAAERNASLHGEPAAEAVEVDGTRIFFAWDAARFPAVRINDAAGRLLARASGTNSYEGLTLYAPVRDLTVAFSDGTRSTVRRVHVFGR